MDLWYNFAKTILRAYLACFVDTIHLKGQENLRPGPKIVAANHPTVTDGFVLSFIIREKLHFLIQAEAFSLPLVGRLLTLADQIPVILGQGREALNTARDKLGQGHAIAIFPEGRLSPGKGFRRAGAGAALLALETGAPLVPVGLYVPPEFIRTLRAHLFGRETVGRWQIGGQCFVQIGELWQLSLDAGVDRSYRVLRDLTEDLMARIAVLTQQAKEEAHG